jgi:DNA-binding NarL/FixJ family response regulator
VKGGCVLEKSTISVLVVDDYEPWRNFMSSSLQKWPGLQVVGEACDGQEAVQKSRQLQPDLIVLDVGLPTMNGIEAARQIRQQLPNAKILFCSENLSPDIAEEAFRAGAAGYLVKSDAGLDLLPAVISVIGGRRFVSRALAGRAFVETSDSGLVRDQGHVVQFHTDDAVLLDELAALFRGSLGRGCSVAAIITSSHRNGLESRLLAQGIDVSEATQNGRLCLLDADQALSEFMEPAGPNQRRFLSHFGNMLRSLKAATVAKGAGVLVFGEMVAVLWAQKKYEAAIRLEELWNELALTNSFYLCCAYPANAFRDGLTLVPYAKICAQHSQVVSGLEGLRSLA